MLVIGFMEFGGPQVLQVMDLPQPTPAVGEVVVRVAASTVNPTDLMMRAGQQAALMTALTPPYIAGMEFSGHIHSVGDGVSGLSAGQPVMGVVNPRPLWAGNFGGGAGQVGGCHRRIHGGHERADQHCRLAGACLASR